MADTIFSKILLGEIPAHKVYEDKHVLAFLDVGPVSLGHTLVIPKEEVARFDQLSDETAAAMGRVLPRLCRAVMKVSGSEEYNLLQNNGAGAHQAVMHVHFHIIPKPNAESGLQVGWPAGTLADGAELAAKITSVLREEEGKSQTSLPLDSKRPGAAAKTTKKATSAKKALPKKTAAGSADDLTTIFTDGACSGNPGPGGWAWAIEGGSYQSGAEAHTTNQRMELMAALDAVRQNEGPLMIVSDSTYVVNCFKNKWYVGWLKRGWTNSQKKPVANKDIWQPFIELVLTRKNVKFRWVKGHSGDPMNDLVDRLAVEAGHRGGSCGDSDEA